MFFLELLSFLHYPKNVDNLIFSSSAFSKYILYIWKFSVYLLLKPSLKDFWKFSVYLLLKPSLKDFEHYLASNCMYMRA